MDVSQAPRADFRYEAFISYSRKDREFAERLEEELRRYRPPKDLRSNHDQPVAGLHVSPDHGCWQRSLTGPPGTTAAFT
jgi:hypothetical protein